MKARLDDKVDRVRSQIMNFSSDGIQVTLNVPQTDDVKETFGSMIDTVVEQEAEIKVINNNLETVVEDTGKNQEEIVSWASKLIEDLRSENQRLSEQLRLSHEKMKNLSYNIQGYSDDEDSAHAIENLISVKSQVKFLIDNVQLAVPKLKKTNLHHDDSKPTLFPTEEGALIDLDATDGFAIAAPPTINTTAVTIEEELSPSSSSSSSTSTTGPIRRKTMQEKELLKIYYQQIGPNTFPPRSETASRWRWAIKKVRTLYRLKRFKFGFTRQRLATVYHRWSRGAT